MPVASKRGYDVTVVSRMGIVLMPSSYLPSKSSTMLRIPNELVPLVKEVVTHWRSGNQPRVESLLQESIALLESGNGRTFGPLPVEYQECWQSVCGEASGEFLAWAIASFLLREKFVEPGECSRLPWIVIADGQKFYEMA